MANIKQAKKRILVNARKRERNMRIRSAVKTAIRKARRAIESREIQKSQELVKKAIKAVDKAAAKGVIHKNNAARKKSRLMKKLNSAMVEATE